MSLSEMNLLSQVSNNTRMSVGMSGLTDFTINRDYKCLVSSLPVYLGPGRRGSSLSREIHTLHSPATFTSSSGGIPKRSQASREI